MPVDERPFVFVDPGSDARLSNPSRRSRTSSTPFTQRSSRPSQARARSGAFAARTSAPRRQSPSWYDGPDERALREEQAKRTRPRTEAREMEEERPAGKVSLAQRVRKLVAKRKADKMFGAADAPASGESGPRAAVYKGEMGASQRRASRMQGAAADEDQGKRRRRSLRFGFGPKLRIAAAMVGCLALMCVFLYQPAQQYYSAMRHNAALEAEYTALQQRDEALQDSVDSLSTEAGMEDLAREQLDWVKSGEVAVSASGLEADSDSTSSSIPPNVATGSIEPPDTWYSGILDPLFGVN
ncbi:MAG: septum formation initiator family protein [Eggerthellaceae bacterium]|nr:septum formation initiator family protein [Eggerthellaceae bacterium]